LMLTIREGAKAVLALKKTFTTSPIQVDPIQQQQQHQQHVEIALEKASRACRALRDLCALSPELAACTVDSILGANQS
jgi:hypothetical protein